MQNKLHLISGPRNISTALMYSFGNRQDTAVIDEPFYAHYLKMHPEIEHPGREETLQSQSTDYKEVVSTLINPTGERPNLFIKNMAHHLDGCDWSFINQMKNIFLIRNPRQLIASFAQVIEKPTMLDIGLELEYLIYEYTVENNIDVLVIDSGELLKDSKSYFMILCQELSIPFTDRMLSWEPGPRPEDGVWAKYWYANVHTSSGFKKQKTSNRPFPENLKPLLERAQHYYDLLYNKSIKL